jgi:hypothetical protein
MLQIMASLNENSRDIIYDRNIFIIQSTGKISTTIEYLVYPIDI